MTQETAFLSEVEDFLTSCNLASLQELNNSNGNESLSTGEDSQAHEAKAKSKTEERDRHLDYRRRQRAERERLVQEVEELEKKLITEPGRMQTISAWKMVERHSLESRLASEDQNRRLRAAVSAQSRLIREYRDQLGHGREGKTSYQRKTLQLGYFDAEFYKTSERQFNTIYAQTDEVLSDIGLDSTDEDCRSSTQERQDENGTKYFQVTDKRKVESDFDQTCSTLRRALLLHKQEDQHIYDGMEDPTSTVAFKFRMSTQLKTGEAASVLVRLINRRYEKDNRLVVVWRAFCEGEEAFNGLYVDEIGWSVATSSTEGGSLLRVCTRYVPMTFGSRESEEQKSLSKQFTNMVVEASTASADEIAHRLEKLLLHDEEHSQ